MILFYFSVDLLLFFFNATKIRRPIGFPLPKQATYYFQRLYLAALFLRKIARYIGDQSIRNNHGRRFCNCHYHRYSNHSNHRKYCRYFNYFKYCKFCHYSLQSIASLFLLLLFLFSLFLFVFLVIITGTVITTGSSFSLHG